MPTQHSHRGMQLGLTILHGGLVLDAPELDSPADDPGAAARLVDYTPTLTLAAEVENATLYRWQIATDSGFNTIVYTGTENAPTIAHTVATDLTYAAGGFWWRARAERNGGVSDWSTPRQFFLHTYQSYAALQIANAGGGAEWPMNDEAGNQVIDNRANTDPISSTNLLTNGDMESWASATNLNSWTESTSGSSTINQETSDVHGGSNACRLDVDGAQSVVGIVQGIAATIGKTYRVRWWAKVNDATGGPTMRTDVSANTGLNIPLTTTYAQYMRRVVASSTNPGVVPQRSTNCANRSIYLDDFEIVEDGDHDLQPPNANIGTLYQRPGEEGENDAIEMDGGVSMLTYHRYTNGRNTLYIHFMINPDATGANDRLIFKSGELDVLFNSDGTVSATANYSSSNATCTTSTTFSTGTWQHFAFSLSDSDKLPRIYKNGVECAYASQTAGVGTRSSTSNLFQLFKDSGANGFDGKAQKGLFLIAVPSSTVIANLYALRNKAAA